MAKRNHSPGIKQLTRRGMARFIARTRKFVDAKAKDRDANSRPAERRRKQMLAGKLKASNGVVMQFEEDLEPAVAHDVNKIVDNNINQQLREDGYVIPEERTNG